MKMIKYIISLALIVQTSITFCSAPTASIERAKTKILADIERDIIALNKQLAIRNNLFAHYRTQGVQWQQELMQLNIFIAQKQHENKQYLELNGIDKIDPLDKDKIEQEYKKLEAKTAEMHKLDAASTELRNKVLKMKDKLQTLKNEIELLVLKHNTKLDEKEKFLASIAQHKEEDKKALSKKHKKKKKAFTFHGITFLTDPYLIAQRIDDTLKALKNCLKIAQEYTNNRNPDEHIAHYFSFVVTRFCIHYLIFYLNNIDAVLDSLDDEECTLLEQKAGQIEHFLSIIKENNKVIQMEEYEADLIELLSQLTRDNKKNFHLFLDLFIACMQDDDKVMLNNLKSDNPIFELGNIHLLYFAAYFNSLKIARLIITSGNYITTPFDMGIMPVLYAASPEMRTLLNNETSINQANEHGLTPLMLAIESINHHEQVSLIFPVINLLLKNGACIDLSDKNGQTVIQKIEKIKKKKIKKRVADMIAPYSRALATESIALESFTDESDDKSAKETSIDEQAISKGLKIITPFLARQAEDSVKQALNSWKTAYYHDKAQQVMAKEAKKKQEDQAQLDEQLAKNKQKAVEKLMHSMITQENRLKKHACTQWIRYIQKLDQAHLLKKIDASLSKRLKTKAMNNWHQFDKKRKIEVQAKELADESLKTAEKQLILQTFKAWQDCLWNSAFKEKLLHKSKIADHAQALLNREDLLESRTTLKKTKQLFDAWKHAFKAKETAKKGQEWPMTKAELQRDIHTMCCQAHVSHKHYLLPASYSDEGVIPWMKAHIQESCDCARKNFAKYEMEDITLEKLITNCPACQRYFILEKRLQDNGKFKIVLKLKEPYQRIMAYSPSLKF